jgi:hypothetical protein
MARGKEGKAKRKEARKEAQNAVDTMLNAGATEEIDEDLSMPPSSKGPVVETVEDSDDDDLVLPTPKIKKKKKKKTATEGSEASDETKYTNRAVKAAGAGGASKGIKSTPLILLIMMVGTTLLPALIFASDYLGNFLAKNNVMGAVGFRLGIGQTPKKRVLSFYEKHDPAKIEEVPKILSKYYGDYPKLIKSLERKYQDYGYFIEWEQDEAPMTLAFEQLAETREYIGVQFNTYAPQPIKTAARNIRYNVNTLYKKFRKLWKKHAWPILEPIFGVPKGAAAQKRKDKAEARKRKAQATGTKHKNTEYRDDMEDEH